MHEPKQFVVTDPRTFDGDVFTVADRAIGQLEALIGITGAAAYDAELMALNASMERECQADMEPDAVGWPDSHQGRKWSAVHEALKRSASAASALRKAAAYDPRHPPK